MALVTRARTSRLLAATLMVAFVAGALPCLCEVHASSAPRVLALDVCHPGEALGHSHAVATLAPIPQGFTELVPPEAGKLITRTAVSSGRLGDPPATPPPKALA